MPVKGADIFVSLQRQKERACMDKIGDIIQNRPTSLPSYKESPNVNVNNNNSKDVNVNSAFKEIEKILEKSLITPEAQAEYLAKELDDPGSLACYRILVANLGFPLLSAELHELKQREKHTLIRKKGAYFLGILRKKGHQIRFRKEVNR